MKRKLYLKNSGALDELLYSVHYFVSNIFYKNKNKYSDKADFYSKHHYVIFEELLDKNDCEQICREMDQAVTNKNLQRNEDLYIRRYEGKDGPSLTQWFRDLFLNNLVIYYAFPKDYLSEIIRIFHPVKSIPLIKWNIEKQLQPIANELIGAHTKVFNVFCYITKNDNQEETHNLNSNWHLDGDMQTGIKTMVYLNDVDDDNGPFALEDPLTKERISVTAKKGSVVFFNSAKVLHSATNTKTHDRYCFSFLSYPALQNTVNDAQVPADILRPKFPFLPFCRSM